jgi:hypothetical protein
VGNILVSDDITCNKLGAETAIVFTQGATSPFYFCNFENGIEEWTLNDYSQNSVLSVTNTDRFVNLPNATSKWRFTATTVGDLLTVYGGGIGIGTTSLASSESLKIYSGTANANYLTFEQNQNQEQGIQLNRTGAPSANVNWYNYLQSSTTTLAWFVTGVGDVMTLSTAGDLDIAGALSKGSGSFDIQHPLYPESKEKRLVHSFVEGSRCDLIYRGRKELVEGKGMVNLDREITSNGIGMEEGTWEALCGNAQCFVTNNESWSRVRGRLEGKFLHIYSEDTTALVVDWLVIAERKDNVIKNWKRTDKNGHLLLEYTKDPPCEKCVI